MIQSIWKDSEDSDIEPRNTVYKTVRMTLFFFFQFYQPGQLETKSKRKRITSTHLCYLHRNSRFCTFILSLLCFHIAVWCSCSFPNAQWSYTSGFKSIWMGLKVCVSEDILHCLSFSEYYYCNYIVSLQFALTSFWLWL